MIFTLFRQMKTYFFLLLLLTTVCGYAQPEMLALNIPANDPCNTVFAFEGSDWLKDVEIMPQTEALAVNTPATTCSSDIKAPCDEVFTFEGSDWVQDAKVVEAKFDTHQPKVAATYGTSKTLSKHNHKLAKAAQHGAVLTGRSVVKKVLVPQQTEDPEYKQ